MKTVLYTYDLEPITVVDIPIDSYKTIEERNIHYFYLAITPEVITTANAGDAIGFDIKNYKVCINIEQFEFYGKRKFFFFVNEEDLTKAFRLRAEYLPGQNRLRDETFKKGVAEGMLRALDTMFNAGMF